MKVLITHERFLPDFGGGGELIVYETAKGLANRGVDVKVLTTGDPALDNYEGIPTRRLPMHRYRMNLAVSEIAKAARDADIVHTFNYHACWSSLRAGQRADKPVVCTILGLFQSTWRQLRGRVLAPVFCAWERTLLRLPFDRLFFLSEFSRQEGLALGVPAGRSQAICPGVDHGRLRSAANKDDVVLFVGKFSRRKGVHLVLEVARRLPHVPFHLVGWGPEEQTLRAADLDNLTLERGREGEPPFAEYARASIFFFPSEAETFGMVLVEAMASGCAVVSSVPLDFHGIRVPPGEIAPMVQAIDSLWRDRETTAQYGRANLKSAQAYTWDRYTTQMLAAYESLLKEANCFAV